MWQQHFWGTSEGGGKKIKSLCPRLFSSTCTSCEISLCLATFTGREIIQEEPELSSTTRFWRVAGLCVWKSSVCTTPIFKCENLILNDALLTNPENKSGNVANNQSYSYAHRWSSELSQRRSCIPHSSKLLLSSKKNNHKCGAAPVINTRHLHLLKLYYFIVPCFRRCSDVRYLLCVYFFSFKYSAQGCNTHEDNVCTSMIKKKWFCILHACMYVWTLKRVTIII